MRFVSPWERDGTKVHFSDHAVDRYYQRAGKRSTGELREDLKGATWRYGVLPDFVQLSTWHRGLATGSLFLDSDRAFIVNRAPDGNLVAVSFVTRPSL
jgi:hypothetical protein